MIHSLALSTGVTKTALDDATIKKILEQRAREIPNTPLNARKQVMKNSPLVSPLRVARHKTIGATKRFWGGKGGFNSKWGNRAAVLSGLLGATGLGIRAYNELNKTGGSNPYVHDTAFIPPPVKQPNVPTPGPSTKPLKLTGTKSTSTPSTTKSTTETKNASDSTDFLLAGGLGGAGGWLLGKELVKPLIAARERRLQEALQNLQHTKKYAPIGAAAAGAIILAALSSLKRNKERQPNGLLSNFSKYDKSNSGFIPNELQDIRQIYQ